MLVSIEMLSHTAATWLRMIRSHTEKKVVDLVNFVIQTLFVSPHLSDERLLRLSSIW